MLEYPQLLKNIPQFKNSELAQHNLQNPQELRPLFRKAAGGTHLHLYSFATTPVAVFYYTELEISDMFLWYLYESEEQYVTIYKTERF